LISRFKEANIDRIENTRIDSYSGKGETYCRRGEWRRKDGMLVSAISSLVSHLSEYLKSQSEIKEE
jgi:hypothetical protein